MGALPLRMSCLGYALFGLSSDQEASWTVLVNRKVTWLEYFLDEESLLPELIGVRYDPKLAKGASLTG